MYMFLWSNVLCDWSCGMVVIIAPSLKAALKMLLDNKHADIHAEVSKLKPCEKIKLEKGGEPRLYIARGGA